MRELRYCISGCKKLTAWQCECGEYVCESCQCPCEIEHTDEEDIHHDNRSDYLDPERDTH